MDKADIQKTIINISPGSRFLEYRYPEFNDQNFHNDDSHCSESLEFSLKKFAIQFLHLDAK